MSDLSEEQQIENIKRWWKQYGTAVILACVLVGAGFFGWNQYQNVQERKAKEGSELYQRFVLATEQYAEQGQGAVPQQLTGMAEQIVDEFGNTLYADFARLYLARLAVEGGEPQHERALEMLSAVADNGATEEIRAIGRLRLGRVMAAQGQAEEAISLLSSNVPAAFTSAYAEARGDILLGQQRFPEARTAYQAAMQNMTDPRSPRRSLMQLKIDNTRTASDDPAVMPANPHGSVVPVDSNAELEGA